MTIYDAIFGTRDGAKFGRIDTADTSDQPSIHFDADVPSDDTAIVVTQPDDRYAMTFEKAQKLVCFLGAPDAPLGTVEQRCFETRPVDARGPSESPMIVEYPNGMISASVEYIQDGRHWFSCALTLVKRP